MTKSLKRIHQVKVSLSQEELESLDKIAESMSSKRSTVMRYLLNTYRGSIYNKLLTTIASG